MITFMIAVIRGKWEAPREKEMISSKLNRTLDVLALLLAARWFLSSMLSLELTVCGGVQLRRRLRLRLSHAVSCVGNPPCTPPPLPGHTLISRLNTPEHCSTRLAAYIGTRSSDPGYCAPQAPNNSIFSVSRLVVSDPL